MAKKARAEEPKPGVPAYIVTFSDMVTLLLTFFVLLLTLADEQDPALFDIGKDSFKKAISAFGLGMLPGRSQAMEFGEIQVKYRVDEADDPADPRTISSQDEQLKRLLNRVQKKVSSIPSQIVATKINYSVANISFADSSSVLDSKDEKYLCDFVKNIQQNAKTSSKMLYILGLANCQANEKENLILSSKRAKAVADFIKGNLKSSDSWNIFSWGAGSGGEWTNSESPISATSDIYIAILDE